MNARVPWSSQCMAVEHELKYQEGLKETEELLHVSEAPRCAQTLTVAAQSG